MRDAAHHLEAPDRLGDVAERDEVVELEVRQALEHLVETGAVVLQRLERLVRLGEHDLDVLERDAPAAQVEAHDLAALRDRDDERLGLPAHALGGAVAHAGLARGERRVGQQVDVRAQDARRVLVEDDRAVHLRELEETLRA